MQAARILANLIVMGGGILARAVVQAYRQALASKLSEFVSVYIFVIFVICDFWDKTYILLLICYSVLRLLSVWFNYYLYPWICTMCEFPALKSFQHLFARCVVVTLF